MSVKEFVEDSIANPDNKVIIFAKSWCPYCASVKKIFEKFPDIKDHVQVIELDKRDDGESIQQYLLVKTSQRTVPNVFVNKKHIGGCDDTTKLFDSGELAKLIAE